MISATSSGLFQPLRIGNINLSHRIVLASLTRFRTDPSHSPLPFVKDCYARRASTPGTLLLAEAVVVSRLAGCITHMPEFWSETQIVAWKPVVDAVHAQGSYMFLQICGKSRAASVALQRGKRTASMLLDPAQSQSVLRLVVLGLSRPAMTRQRPGK